jgi:hypothetical protein
MFKSTLCVAILLPIVAAADQTCDEMQEMEAKINADTPRAIDEATELVQLTVNCETHVVSYKKRLLVSGNLLAEGARERKQRQHTQLHCNRDGIASQMHWTAMDVLYDVDYKYMFTLTTTPASCAGVVGTSTDGLQSP